MHLKHFESYFRTYPSQKSSLNNLLKGSNMKNVILAASLVFVGTTQAMADGFTCQANDGSLNIKVYHHVHAEDGTRDAAILIFSDPTVTYGRKTIATFEADRTLINVGARYLAKADQRFTGSRRDGELIGGTKLGQLGTIALDVDFSYGSPVEEGEEVPAVLTLNKRNGQVIEIETTCARYLKAN